ncbi:MAG: hypothetical protein ACK55Z_10350, partial [bacterium]
MQAKRTAVGRRRVRERCAHQSKRVAIKRRIQMRFANVLLGSISARRRNRGGHLEGCLQRLSHHLEITWTVL